MRSFKLWMIFSSLTLGCIHRSGATPSKPDLIPRSDFFSNTSRPSYALSPDGQWLGDHTSRTITVAPITQPQKTRNIVSLTSGRIAAFYWTSDSSHIIYKTDQNGEQLWRLFIVDLKSGKVRPLTPEGKYTAEIVDSSEPIKNETLIEMNDRDPKFHDAYRLNLTTGQLKLVFKNNGFKEYITDEDSNLRIVGKFLSDGGREYYKINNQGQAEARPFLKVKAEDSFTSWIKGISKGAKSFYMIDTGHHDFGELKEIDWKTGQARTLATAQKGQFQNIIMHPTTRKVLAISEHYLLRKWQAIDPTVQKDIDIIDKEAKGSWDILSRTADERIWFIGVDRVVEPYIFYLYDREKQSLIRLPSSQSELKGKTLSPMYGREIVARDGTVLPSYLSLPKSSDPDGDGIPDRALPMVLLVHGGPWDRDVYGYQWEHQLLTSRGIAVLSVNFRGSTGFGKSFLNKGNREFAGKMHDDLIDAVNWTIKNGIAQKEKIAIMGYSYGGYAALVGLTFTPETFACGIDSFGMSNLVSTQASAPADWEYLIASMRLRMGDPRTESGKNDLLARSPITRAGHIKRPLLMTQGANDHFVVRAESDQMVAAMKAASIPVTYVLYPDEGHGYSRYVNLLSFAAIAEKFLGTCLGTPVEPYGSDLEGSSLQVQEGVELIEGLNEALKATKKP